VERTRKSVDVAKEQLSRRQLTSPLTGIVVEKLRHRGEWVEVGEPVLRIIRIDRLFVEGYVDAALVDQSSRGRPVSVTGDSRQGPITVEGTLIFVSPEIDSVNGQVEVKAEISNPALALRPGQPVQMTIP
jgi:multidrug efflux pump subunit AcrA (membrane-fusion protein)